MRDEDFDRNRALQTGVESTVDFSHAARAQQTLDFVRPEFRARGQGHNSGNYNCGRHSSELRAVISDCPVISACYTLAL